MNNKYKKQVKSDKNNYYEIEIYGKSILEIIINQKNENNKKLSPKKYKNVILSLEDLKSSKYFKYNEEFQKLKDLSKIIRLLEDNNNIIKLKEDLFNLILIIELPKPFFSFIELNIEQLNVEYYFTTGPNRKRINTNPFYASLNENFFSVNIINEILKNDKIINYFNIDSYHYYKEENEGFEKLNEIKEYDTPKNGLILELHFNRDIIPLSTDINIINNNLWNKIKKIKNEIKNNIIYTQKTKKYDLIYLYASPLIGNKGGELYNPINYRKEIKAITKIFNKTGKSYKCLFECANEKLFKGILMEKQLKILHIASHGDLDQRNEKYHLILENNLNQQNVSYDKLKKILEAYSSNIKKIDLVFVATCHSEKLGELFAKYAKNVIYITGMTPISNIAALKFSELFYKELVNRNSIKDSFYKVQEKIKSDREIIIYNKNNCCCSHKHDKDCLIKENNNMRSKIHNTLHNEKCLCHFSEFHMHKLNCNIYKKVKEKIRELEERKNKGEKIPDDEDLKFSIKEFKDYVKICCCNHDIKHDEASKFILAPKPHNDTIPFELQEKGKLEINENCIFDFDYNKDFFVIGRAKNMEKILNILSDNTGYNSHFIIIYGDKDMGKQEFAESVCVYLFERKLIKLYEIINISTKYDLESIKNKISNYNKNLQEKIIIIIKINYLLDEEKTITFVNQILNEIIIENNNLYFIILMATQKVNIENDLKGINKFETINFELKFNSSKKLLIQLCDYFGFQNNYFSIFGDLSDDNFKELFQSIKYKPKKIMKIADLVGVVKNFEQLIETIKSEDYNEKRKIYEIEKLMETFNISRIYYLLALMPSGLPESLLTLIYPNYEEFMKEEDVTKSLIYTDPNDNWKYIKQYKKIITSFFCSKEKDEIRQECISNFLKVYAKLLFYYIEKNRQKICFPDNNIHYIFNSYNGTGIWKTFDLPIYNYCFYFENDKNKYDSILKDEFILERHEKNIANLILNNLDDLNKLIKNDINKEYLEQILLMIPSCYFFQRECIKIIRKYIHICEQLNLENSKKRLTLFLYSLEKNQQINIKELNECEIQEDLEIEAYFLNALKKKDITLFKEFIEKYKDITTTINGETFVDDITQKKIIYSYYEIANLYYSEENYYDAIINLIEAKEIAKKTNNYFLMDRINIDLFLIKKKKLKKENENETIIFDNNHNYLEEFNKILDEVIHQRPYYKKLKSSLINEAYNLKLELNKKLENDIVILNSNPLTNNFSVLNRGIFSNLNNQYYLLEKLQEKIKMKLKIESKTLNKDNLLESLNQNGKILIIQSDDFTENGEIIFETEYGESQVLSIDSLETLLPEKIKFTILILCFIKSGKLKKLFEDKVQYLITFDDIECYDLTSDDLYKFNELSIEFLINFIEKTEVKNKKIEDIFEESKKVFTDGLKYCTNIKNFISLTNKNNLINYIKYGKNKDQGRVYLNQPLVNIPPYAPLCKDYAYEIYNIIKLILSGEYQFINVFLNQDDRIQENNSKKLNKKSIIGLEIIKFLYRHQRFDKLYYIYNPQKYGKSLKEIIDNALQSESGGEIIYADNDKDNDNLTKFILINNYTKIKNKDKKLNKEKGVIFEEPIKLKDKIKYLIMTKNEIIFDKENKIKSNDKKYKNEIIMKNIDFSFCKICLKNHNENYKKFSKNTINTDENIITTNENEINIDENSMNNNKINIIEDDDKNLMKENNLLMNFKSIFEYSFDSNDSSSYYSESESDIST